MHSRFTAVFDACVFYPATLRNLLLQLATTGLFRARWTAEINDEWMRSLLRDKPDIDPSRLELMREQMDRAVPDGLVTGHEALIDGIKLPDADDRHVVAAAVRCHAAVIVTTNLRDFPNAALEPYGLSAQHPDEFISDLIDLEPGTVCGAVKTVRRRLKAPPYAAAALLDLLQAQGLLGTATRLRGFVTLL